MAMVERARLKGPAASEWSLGIRATSGVDGIVLVRWSNPRVRLETYWPRPANGNMIAKALRKLASEIEKVDPK
jgi:hypothetical protein